MEHYRSTTNPKWHRFCIVALALLSTTFLFSFTFIRMAGDDLWQRLHITQEQGTERIKSSFLNGYFDSRGVSNIKSLMTGDKVAIAKDAIVYAKGYLNSATFIKEYQTMRNSSKPSKPTTSARSKEDIRKEKVEQTEKDIIKSEDLIKTAKADLKPIFESMLETQKNMLKDYKDPNSMMIELMYQSEVDRATSDAKHYEKDMANWSANYPEDYKQFIKVRLQHYLDVANTVDFTATTVEKNSKQRFTNPQYEAKSNEWKMIYRADKEIYDATKPFAEQWLREIN